MPYQKAKSFMSNISDDLRNGFQDYRITQIDFENLRPNPLNAETYDPTDPQMLAALKDNIKENGLGQPLLVKKNDDGTYTIISGHTRYTCISMIREEDPGKFLKVPCSVWQGELSPAQEKLLLVTQNIQRTKTPADISREIKAVQSAYDEMTARGELPGKSAQEFISACTNLSVSSVYRYGRIEDNLIPEAKERFNSGDMSVNVADRIASMPEDRQEEVLEKLSGEGKITPGMVEEAISEKEEKEPSISVRFTLSELRALLGPGKYTKKKLKERIIAALSQMDA